MIQPSILLILFQAANASAHADVAVDPRFSRAHEALEALTNLADAARDERGDAVVFDRAYDGKRSQGRVIRASFDGFTPPPTPLPLKPEFGNTAPPPQIREPVAPIGRAPEVVQPIAAQPAVGVGSGGMNDVTPCQDLRNKAARLDTAANLCQQDIANGAPFCRVTIPYDSPNIPKSLEPGAALGHAQRFRDVAARADEYACRSFGGEGNIPNTSGDQMSALRRVADIFDTRANAEIKWMLMQWVLGRNVDHIEYDVASHWTQGLSRHTHMDFVRSKIRQAYQNGGGQTSDDLPYTLNKLSLSENIALLLRDMIAAALGLNMSYTTGSFRLHWQQAFHDSYARSVRIHFTASDALRLSSATRIPTKDSHLISDNFFGPSGPMHNIGLKWDWFETIYY